MHPRIGYFHDIGYQNFLNNEWKEWLGICSAKFLNTKEYESDDKLCAFIQFFENFSMTG